MDKATTFGNAAPAAAVAPVVRSRAWALVPFGVAVAAAAALTVLPVYATSSCTTTATGASACTSGTDTLLGHEGAGVLVVLAVPVLLTAVPIAVRGAAAATVVAVLLTAGVFLGALSIGVFFLPAAVAAWVYAVVLRADVSSVLSSGS